MMTNVAVVYLLLTLIVGLSISTTSKRFQQMIFWKQIAVLLISPLLVIREIFYHKEVKK